MCPVLCKGNGIYVRGACQCYPGWKGKECDVPEDECEVPSCHGNGKCVNGECICFPGYGGKDCGKGNLPRPPLKCVCHPMCTFNSAILLCFVMCSILYFLLYLCMCPPMCTTKTSVSSYFVSVISSTFSAS